MLNNLPKIPLQTLDDKLFQEKQVQVFMLRLDQSDTLISGNKWFKLKYNIEAAKKNNYQTLLSFGGAYSNHIHAVAAAAKRYGFSSIGIIRGEAHQPLNETLADAVNMGMHLHYINRQDYRKKNDPLFLDKLIHCFADSMGKIYVIPEGGTNNLALKGAAEIPQLIPINYQYLCLGCGTGGTLAGISYSLRNIIETNIIGFPALKGGEFLNQEIKILQQNYAFSKQKAEQCSNWSLNCDYHFGGFAKKDPSLLSFMSYFQQTHNIELDFLYTGKMMYGIYDLCRKNYFKPQSTIVAIHTGGLQGNRSIKL